jgi:hypothetical protein
MEIREEIIRSAHLFATPDNFRGHGIPDFWVADYALSTQEMPDIQTVNWFPNPSTDGVLAWSGSDLTGKTLEWVSLGGQVVYSHVVAPGEEKVSLPQLKPGLYVIRLNGLRSGLWLRQ